ncbi:proliferating cell nuclear antigen [Lymphocystis disease virus 3]|uniref:Proliferating cell nuclear antigen n=1 Tax=Lymphocystis disease virus 3 TaxID=2560566 RepID=A0A1B2RW59_9VIRU|nr:proliferating cell nuclear antigen [Lymphocystis disease virus Sa]AOC55228.1 proliferating cell nuclear antigen [Lymphocystis disease virus 3]
MFTAVIPQAAKFKNLMELLFNNLDAVVLKIDPTGIHVNETVGCVDIAVKLPYNCFSEYIFSESKAVYLGLGTNVAYDFKNIKNKSKIRFSVVQLPTEIEPLVLKIETFPTEGELRSSIVLTVESVEERCRDQNSFICDEPDEIKILAKDFAAVCKSFKSGSIAVSKMDGCLIMSTGVDGLKTKEFVFGQETNAGSGVVHFTLEVDKMLKLAKLASFADKYISVEVKTNFLIFKAVNELGVIAIKCNSR